MSSNSASKPFNPWPWSIMAFFAVAICAAVVWVTFCVRLGTDLVAADYYEREIEYQAQMDREQRVQELSGTAQIAYDGPTGIIRVRLPSEHAEGRAEGEIHLYRPSEASLDRKLPLEVGADGVQLVNVRPLRPGLWEVRVDWTANDEEFFMSQKVTIEGQLGGGTSQEPVLQ